MAETHAPARRLKLTLAYDGTEFHGWQRQDGVRTVQGELETALRVVLDRQQIEVVGASRTDQGVHAWGQVSSFALSHPIPCARLARAMNGRLPPDVRVRHVEEVDHDFSARFSAIGKHYLYRIDWRAEIDPFSRRFVAHVPLKLDVERMRLAAERFVGEYDFAPLSCVSGQPVRTTVRRIYASGVEAEEHRIDVHVFGSHFLYKMVRRMVGTLIEVGRGRMAPEDITALLAPNRRPAAAGPTAPPEGLFLVKVYYTGDDLDADVLARRQGSTSGRPAESFARDLRPPIETRPD